jgi:hypothetical protein
MKVFVLGAFTNEESLDNKHGLISVCDSVDKCKEKALQMVKNKNPNIDNFKIYDIAGSNKPKNYAFMIIKNDEYMNREGFWIWETKLK